MAQAEDLATKIQSFLNQMDNKRLKVTINMSPSTNMDSNSPVFFPMDFNVDVIFIGSEAEPSSFTVFTDEQNKLDLDDVLSWGDSDFFSTPDESKAYFDLVSFLRTGKLPSQKAGFIRLYRGMSSKERDAWEAGQTIPDGKFFTNKATAEFSQDISGEVPDLYSFLVDNRVVTETSPGEFQTTQESKLNGKKIVPLEDES
jgi:hypothetical protein